jgi:hypothetical protein
MSPSVQRTHSLLGAGLSGRPPEPFAPEIASRYLKGKPSEGCHHGWKNDLEGVYPFQSFRCAVKLHPAVKEERMQFHLLHRRDHVKLKQMFHGWTDEGIMRQPVFLRLREEMAAREVVRH